MNLSKEEVEIVQSRLLLFAVACGSDDDFSALLTRYLDQSRPQWDGTMDPILMHSMSIRDMRKAQANLKFLCRVGEQVLTIRKLAKEKLSEELGNPK